MKKRFIFPSLLLGTLLAVPVPISTNAAILEVDKVEMEDPTISGTIQQIAGVRLKEGNILTGVIWTNSTPQGTPGTPDSTFSGIGNVYNLGLVDISTSEASGSWTLGVQAGPDYTGTYNLSGINIIKTADATGDTVGFEFNSSTDKKDFAGTINGGNIVIDSSVGTSYGARFLKAHDTIPNKSSTAEIVAGKKVHFNLLDIKGSAVEGVEVGDIQAGGELRIDEAIIDGGTGYASVVHVNTGYETLEDATGTGKIIIGKATVVGGGDVAAVTFNGGGGQADGDKLWASNVQVELGETSVTARTGYSGDDEVVAVGVRGSEISNVTLKGNLTTKNEANPGASYGVYAGNADIKIDGNVTISTGTGGGEAFKTAAATVDDQSLNGGDLTITQTAGSVLDTTASAGVASEGAFAISGGTFKSGKVTADSYKGDNVIIEISKDNLAASAITEKVNGKSLYNLNNARVKVDGKYTEADLGTLNFAVKATGDTAVIINKTQEVVFGSDGSVADVVAAEAPITGGYVNAMRMHHNYTTWNAVSNHLLSNIGASPSAGNGYGGGDYRGQECDPCDPIGACDPCGSLSSTVARTAWVNYVARSNEYDDLFGGVWDFDSEGIQTGTDLYRTKRSQFGMLFGYESGRMRNSLFQDRVENDNMYVGIYGSRIFRNGWDVRGSFSYGWQEYDMNRFEINGDQFASSFDGKTSETTLEVGKRLFNGNWSLRPVLGMDIYTNNTDGAAETAVGTPIDGSNATKYSKNSLTQTFLRTGADLTWQRKRLAFNTGLFYSYDLHGENLVTAIDIDGNGGQLTGTALGRELLSWNVGGSVKVAKNLDVFMGYRGESILDGDGDGVNNTAYVGAAWKW